MRKDKDIEGYVGFRVHAPNDWVLGCSVVGILVQFLGKCMIYWALGPLGLLLRPLMLGSSQGRP